MSGQPVQTPRTPNKVGAGVGTATPRGRVDSSAKARVERQDPKGLERQGSRKLNNASKAAVPAPPPAAAPPIAHEPDVNDSPTHGETSDGKNKRNAGKYSYDYHKYYEERKQRDKEFAALSEQLLGMVEETETIKLEKKNLKNELEKVENETGELSVMLKQVTAEAKKRCFQERVEGTHDASKCANCQQELQKKIAEQQRLAKHGKLPK